MSRKKKDEENDNKIMEELDDSWEEISDKFDKRSCMPSMYLSSNVDHFYMYDLY